MNRIAEWRLVPNFGWELIDNDGTLWVITLDATGGATLTMTYREHRLASHHADVDAAKRHHRDMVAMWTSRTMRDYAERRA